MVPFTSEAAGDARNTTAPATSFGSPMRPKGILPTVCFRNSGSDKAGRVPSVQMKVGATALTQML